MTDPVPIIDWLLSDARALPDPAPLLEGLCARLIAAALPIWRATLHLPQLHPQLYSVTYLWLTETRRATERRFSRQEATRTTYHNSPVGQMHRTGRMVRRRLTGPEAELDFPLLEELAEQGVTEYVLLPMPLGNGGIVGLSLSTHDPAGFTEGQIRLVKAITPALGAVCEIMIGRATTRGLLDTYVGHEAGERILAGQITLGSGRSIEAVIFFSDLRNYTALSETLPRHEVLRLLNDYFGCMVGAVHKAGGEVLKYIGDGLLAIFRLGEGEARDEACARSLIAALEATAALDRVNDTRRAERRVEAHAGIALHVGTLLYGNIGADDRLDFTVIGPVVNRAARISGLCAVLGEPILTSRAFAAASPVKLLPRGQHMLKGLAKPQKVFAPLRQAPDPLAAVAPSGMMDTAPDHDSPAP